MILKHLSVALWSGEWFCTSDNNMVTWKFLNAFYCSSVKKQNQIIESCNCTQVLTFMPQRDIFQLFHLLLNKYYSYTADCVLFIQRVFSKPLTLFRLQFQVNCLSSVWNRCYQIRECKTICRVPFKNSLINCEVLLSKSEK